MRIGLFGGSFDPVHYGHLLLAESAREQLALDQVWLIPAGQSPFKPQPPVASAKQRVEMLQLAVAGYPQFLVSDVEIQRSGPSYTVETLRAVHEAQPDAELFLLIGADSLADFAKWREPEEILKLAQVVAVNRGRAAADAQPVLAELGETWAGRLPSITMPGVDFSSTDLRARVAAGRSLRFQTPRAVELYLQSAALYLQPAGQ